MVAAAAESIARCRLHSSRSSGRRSGFGRLKARAASAAAAAAV